MSQAPVGESLSPPAAHLPRQVWILAIVGCLVALGFGVMSPVLPIYARMFGVSSFLVGLVVSSLAILRLATMPVASWLMRFVGARELAIVGCLLVGGTSAMIGLANSYWGILIWRGLGGFGSAMYGVSNLVLLFRAAPAHLRGRANAVSAGGFVIGGMAGPAVGGLIAEASIHAPFFSYAGTLLAATVVLIVFLPRAGPAGRTASAATGVGLLDLARDRRFRAVMVANFGNGWQSYGVRGLLIPLFVVEVAQRSITWSGIAFTIAAVAQAASLPLVGWSTDRLGRRFVLLAGALTTAAVSVGLALTGSYALMVVLLCVYAVGASATGSASQAMLADTVPTSNSSGLAAYQMAGDTGTILGPLVAGAILDAASMTWAWLVGALIILIGVTLTWGTPRTIQPPAAHQAGPAEADQLR
jgi:MFS family permease